MTSIANYPTQYENWLRLKNGRAIFVRPIRQTDEQLVVDLFKKLSANSVYLRFLRHLQALPKELLHQFTHINYNSEFALVGMNKENGKEAIVAVARYVYNFHDNIADLAVTVRDDWQYLGLGKLLLQKIVEIGQEHNIFRFGGMIDPQNKIIRRILLELGFKVKYSLRSGFFQVEILV